MSRADYPQAMLLLLSLLVSIVAAAHELDGDWNFSKDCSETGYHYTGSLELKVSGRTTGDKKIEGTLDWIDASFQKKHWPQPIKSQMNGSLSESAVILHRKDLAPNACIATFTGTWKSGEKKVTGSWRNEQNCGNQHTGTFVLTREKSADADQSVSTVDFGTASKNSPSKALPRMLPAIPARPMQ